MLGGHLKAGWGASRVPGPRAAEAIKTTKPTGERVLATLEQAETGQAKYFRWFVLLTVLVNASAMLSPIINNGDAITYASIARHIALSHDWARLILDGHDWLDKPHFPFWMTAISFELAGVSARTYILPGFIFHLIGAYYTYRLAAMLYDKQAAMLAVLIYVSIFNLMDSSIEIRAEAYLRAQVMGACYYWWRYDRQFRVKYLLLGAIFTGMAIMTKGIFVLLTICSGFLCLWLYQKQWSKLFTFKWLAALTLSMLAAAPELIALHLQFNQLTGGAEPQQPTSVFKFFFWDSQFGRFLNTGPIQNHSGYPFYFVFAFLWGFLPWTLLSFAAIYTAARDIGKSNASERSAFVFLISMFLCTFLMFSATTFQMAYYIDIILPFMGILLANYLNKLTIGKPLFIAQMCLVAILALLPILLSIYTANPGLVATIAAICSGLLYYVYTTRAASLKFRVISYSVLVINMLFIFSTLLSYLAFSRFSVAYNAGKLLGTQSEIPIYVYQMPEVSRELALYSKAPSHELDTVESLKQLQGRYYLIVQHDRARQLQLQPAKINQLVSMRLVVHKTGTLNKLLRLAKGAWPLESIDFLQSVAH
jgi:4-amino-4-deoxy-L-arabinose transferase-like glycosyltransferase